MPDRSLEQAGWRSEHAEDLVDELLDLIEDWPVGAVIERRLDELQIRA